MKSYRRLGIATLAGLAALACVAPASAAPPDRAPRSAAELKADVLDRIQTRQADLGKRGLSAAALPPGSFGNGVFRVYTEHAYGLGIGGFTVLTGPEHPAGEGKNVLFGNGVPGTSYLIVRRVSGDTTTDYVQSALLTHETEQLLDEGLLSTEPVGDTGYEFRWSLDDPAGSATVTETINVVGTTTADSRVEVTTTIEPPAGSTDHFEVQYIWDTALDADDGPALQTGAAGAPFRPFSPVVTHEDALDADDQALSVVDNDANPATPTLAIGATARGAGPLPVSSAQYVCWPKAIYAPIGEYEADPTLDVSSPGAECTGPSGGNDSALLYHWSADAAGTGQPITVSAALAASPPVPDATALTAAPVLLRVPAFTATLTDTVYGQPVPGRTIAFSVAGTVRCTAVTNASGVASCGTLADGLAATVALGYRAAYPGGAIWAPVSANGPLL